jgi:putative tricarboxylic transport membrane protein
MMQRIHQITAVCFMAFAGFVMWESIQLEYYTKLGPGPGFFPFWLGAVFGGIGLAWLVQVSLPAGRPAERAFLPDRGGILRILAILVAMVAVIGFLNVLGFQLTMFLFLVFLLKILGQQRFWLTIVTALLGSVGVYRLFGGYLDVQLPAASLAFLAKLGL